MSSLEALEKELRALKNPQKAALYQRFFKTGKGEYGEDDIFWGITVPQQRQVAKKYTSLAFFELQKILSSKIHEYRLTALIILTAKYKKADEPGKKAIADFYLKNTKNINNWDLVDLSAPNILGDYFFDKDKAILYKLARSKDLWEKRIAMMATFGFIRRGQFTDALKIAELLLKDQHDLIHKAVGWMLREVGNRDQKIEEKFLNQHSHQMPRVMLRYAIEKFPEEKRRFYLG